MKKKRKITITIFLIIITITISCFSLRSSKNSLEKSTGFDIAIYVNNTPSSSVPNTKSYLVSVDCINANAKWDYDNWDLVFDEITGDVSCNIEFTGKTFSKLNTKISELESTTSSRTDWKVENVNGYRYRGLNPDNYILFNDELWRIVGVFDTSVHGLSGNLVKIIRNDTIGAFSTGVEDSNFVSILNDSYYNSLDATGSDACKKTMIRKVSSALPEEYYELNSVCDFRNIGIKTDYYKNMIVEANWMLPLYTDTVTRTQAYNMDTFSSDASHNSNKIGLISLSDYLYASLDTTSCSDTVNANTRCRLENWLYNGLPVMFNGRGRRALNEAGQSQTHNPENVNVNQVNGGNLAAVNARPSVYLNENVYVIDGDGSPENPYIIGIN